MTKIPQYLLSLAGEYRICSELNKRGIFATVTYGNRKSVDVYAISDRHERALKIEVKTTQQGNFLTGITQKCLAEDPHAPDFWVLFQIRKQDAGFAERFFVLSHQEICAVQAARNQIYSKKYLARHGKEFDFVSNGVDELAVAGVTQYDDQWSKIVDRLGDRAED